MELTVQSHQKQENSNLKKKTHRWKGGSMAASCSSTNQVKGIENFMPNLPDSIGLLNKELKRP